MVLNIGLAHQWVSMGRYKSVALALNTIIDTNYDEVLKQMLEYAGALGFDGFKEK